MRPLLLMMLIVALPGCGEPRCSCRAAALSLVWMESGNPVAGESGDVALDPPTRGCARNTRLQVQSVGLAPATFSLSTSSPSLTVPDQRVTLAAAEVFQFDVKAASGDASTVEGDLVVALDGSPCCGGSTGPSTLQFNLRAAVVEVVPTLPRRLDFAGVEVGGTGALSTEPLLGLPADFLQDGAQLRFSPSDAGYQEVAASRASMLDCPALSSVTVVGDGVPAVLYGPPEVNFGDVRVGDGIELDVAVQNLSFDEVQVALPGTDFTIVSTSTTPSVATRDPQGMLVRGSRSQRVRFSPAAAGPITGQLEATAGSRRLVIPLRAFGAP
ncbi:MAG: hypothetical protein Q8L48_14895 [Archangium sp.]|nr:hypothetical protein [Archangium sp.]